MAIHSPSKLCRTGEDFSTDKKNMARGTGYKLQDYLGKCSICGESKAIRVDGITGSWMTANHTEKDCPNKNLTPEQKVERAEYLKWMCQ